MEKEADNKDRAKEKDELESLKAKIMGEGHPDPDKVYKKVCADTNVFFFLNLFFFKYVFFSKFFFLHIYIYIYIYRGTSPPWQGVQEGV